MLQLSIMSLQKYIMSFRINTIMASDFRKIPIIIPSSNICYQFFNPILWSYYQFYAPTALVMHPVCRGSPKCYYFVLSLLWPVRAVTEFIEANSGFWLMLNTNAMSSIQSLNVSFVVNQWQSTCKRIPNYCWYAFAMWILNRK